jgi:hypothetical protein
MIAELNNRECRVLNKNKSKQPLIGTARYQAKLQFYGKTKDQSSHVHGTIEKNGYMANGPYSNFLKIDFRIRRLDRNELLHLNIWLSKCCNKWLKITLLKLPK